MKHVVMLALLLGAVYQAQAIRIESGKNLVINKPVDEDLYIAGGEILINAPVYGDLIL